MEVTIKNEKTVELKTLRVVAEVRYWEDAKVNGKEDVNGDIPARSGDNWCPVIDIDAGIITNWNQGCTADIHYKVCDCCSWDIYDADGNFVVGENDDYVPNTLCPGGEGFGDYIIMKVDSDGKIDGWKFEMGDFLGGDE